VLGDYVLQREIARGASAVVHLAEDRRDGSQVAVKIALSDPQWSADEAARFRHLFANEASLVGRLVHPNVVRMLAAELGGEPQYIVMEFIEGVPLRQFCQPGHLLPRAQVIQLLFRCARAMDFVHGCKVLHRDLKPSNILLSGDAASSGGGDVKIIDFGAAQIDWAQRTQIGGFVGSPAYMAPEQLQERTTSRATDVYALGVILYELLSGTHPFAGDGGPGIVDRILHGAVQPIAERVPGLPAPLAVLVHKAFARDPRERYADCFSLARDLMACAR
jgi:serine/threonine protein kinase